jgi:hypothetical protein
MPSSNVGNNIERTAAIQDDKCTSQFVGKDDVLFGRGTGPNEHLGNIRFRQMLLKQKKAYKKAKTSQEKSLIAYDIVAAVKAKKGRFLKMTPKKHEVKSGNEKTNAHEDHTAHPRELGTMFVVVDIHTSILKAKQALRYQSDREGFEDEDNETIKNPTPYAADNSSFTLAAEGHEARSLFQEIVGIAMPQPHDLAEKRVLDEILLLRAGLHPSPGSPINMSGLANSSTTTGPAESPAHFSADSVLPGRNQYLPFVHRTSLASAHQQTDPSTRRSMTIALQQGGGGDRRHGASPSAYSSLYLGTPGTYSSSLFDEVVKSSLASPLLVGRGAGTSPSTFCSRSPLDDHQRGLLNHPALLSTNARMSFLDDVISRSRAEHWYRQHHDFDQIMHGQQMEDNTRILMQHRRATSGACSAPMDSMSGVSAIYHQRAVASSFLMNDYKSIIPRHSCAIISPPSSPLAAARNPGSSYHPVDQASTMQPGCSLLAYSLQRHHQQQYNW